MRSVPNPRNAAGALRKNFESAFRRADCIRDGCGKDVNSYMLTNYPNVKNIVIEGGIWNGNASANSGLRRRVWGSTTGGNRIFRRYRLILRNMTIQDSEAFHIRLNYVEDFLVEKIVFEDQIIRHTQVTASILREGVKMAVRHIRRRTSAQ